MAKRAGRLGAPPQTTVHGEHLAAEQLGQGEVLRVVGLRPSQLVSEPPGGAPEPSGPARGHRGVIQALECPFGIRPAYLTSPHGLVEDGPRLGPHQRRRDELMLTHEREAGARATLPHRVARVDDEPQWDARERWMSLTQSGCGSPDSKRSSSGGTPTERGSSTAAARSASSIMCLLPTFRARSLPARIQRLMVSGSRPARRAASVTLSITQRLLHHRVVV